MNTIIGVSVGALATIGYYIWNRKKKPIDIPGDIAQALIQGDIDKIKIHYEVYVDSYNIGICY